VRTEDSQLEHSFLVRTNDPVLDKLKERIDAAFQPDVSRRTAEYYRVKMLWQLAEHYVKAGSPDSISCDNEPAAPSQSPVLRRANGNTSGVRTVNYETVAAIENAGQVDWNQYWLVQREQLKKQLAALEPKSNVPDIFRRMEISSAEMANRPIQSWLTAGLCGCIAGLIASQFICQPRRPRIGLRSAAVLTVPRSWAHERVSVAGWLRERTVGDFFEGMAVVGLLAMCGVYFS
jgi:hypothetical protein